MKKKYKLIITIVAYLIVSIGIGTVCTIVIEGSDTINILKYNQRKELLNKKDTIESKEVKEEEKQNKDEEFQKQLAYAISKLQPKLGPKLSNMFARYILTASKENDIDPILITALIYTESKFDILAHNKKGAVGLMQIRYTIWKEALAKDNIDKKYKLFWPELNIKCGAKILAEYYKQSNHDIVKTIYRYNTGSTKLPKDKGPTDISYINKVMLNAYKVYEFIREYKS